ncbi:SDR family oxidoreductase [Rhodocyclus tenuis]|uniref:SDR family oxidoreductase n=2 Tax=Rhodocyclus TaxID=1064 RepID=A0A6L5JUR7_RHOTE|nr:SDR family oxidoreductase [Rhodocyclus gracilis]MQY50572.1 SDR family oxidoreductase [Rhodocyclus gracilis]MRD72575.1 SDR family oxidoreductase [Rhodocyclus gracilis]NJA88101.1 SDR family oxidoreductase [Rhodocyclus gracilis]
MQNILIIGATSAIAEASARRFAARGDALFLVARDPVRLEHIGADLRLRGAARVATFVMDATDSAAHPAMLDAAEQALGGIDVALIAHGTLPDQKACEASVELTLATLAVNGTSVIALATLIGARFEARKTGVLAVIGSVAGDRGRASNYVYGTAKGMVDIFMQGLRHRLSKSGAQALLIKPGFVDTPMTSSFKKGALWAQPDTIARGIVAAIEARRDVVYLPGFWRWIMLIIRHIPERIFQRTSL